MEIVRKPFTACGEIAPESQRSQCDSSEDIKQLIQQESGTRKVFLRPGRSARNLAGWPGVTSPQVGMRGGGLCNTLQTPKTEREEEEWSLWLRPWSALGKEQECRPLWGGFTARLHGRQLHHGDLEADWAAVFKQRRPQRAGADHWWHGWQMGDRGRTVASSCRPTTDRTAPLSTPSPALALLPWARRPTRLSNSAGLALTSSRPRPMGSAHLHMRGARLRRQGAKPAFPQSLSPRLDRSGRWEHASRQFFCRSGGWGWESMGGPGRVMGG